MKYRLIILSLFFGITAAAVEPPANIIPVEKALATANQVRPGKIQAKELQHDNGRWVYSIDISTNDHVTYEVLVDAISGKFISQMIETPQQ